MKPSTYLTTPCPQDFIKFLELADFSLLRQNEDTGELTYRRGLTAVSINLDFMRITSGGAVAEIFIMHKSYADILQLINDDPVAKTIFPSKTFSKSIKACFQNVRA